MPIPEYLGEELIIEIYGSDGLVKELPSWLYAYTATSLDSSFWAGFGNVPVGDDILNNKAYEFRQNIGRFSGAKTYQNAKELSDYVFDDDGKKRPFAQFREKALKMNEKYNTQWLRTEQDTVVAQAQMARRWHKFESEKDILPVLEYLTVGDGRVRASHKKLNGLRLRVDDPRWRSILPQNEFGCRCTVIQSSELQTTPERTVKSKTKLLMQDFRRNPAFDMNPYYDEVIFKEYGKGKASYFNAPKKDLKNNFGFPNIEAVTGNFLKPWQ